jgi:predicted nucleic acid-binding protein
VIVVDASVAVKWLVPEDGEAAADELLLRLPLITADKKFTEKARPVYSEVRLLGSDQTRPEP